MQVEIGDLDDDDMYRVFEKLSHTLIDERKIGIRWRIGFLPWIVKNKKNHTFRLPMTAVKSRTIIFRWCIETIMDFSHQENLFDLRYVHGKFYLFDGEGYM